MISKTQFPLNGFISRNFACDIAKICFDTVFPHVFSHVCIVGINCLRVPVAFFVFGVPFPLTIHLPKVASAMFHFPPPFFSLDAETNVVLYGSYVNIKSSIETDLMHPLPADHPIALIRGCIGLSELARRIGVSRKTIQRWEKVPAERLLEIERETGIPRERLRPDLYKKETK